MQENRAAFAVHDRIVVEAEHGHDIVEMILPPQMFGACGIGQRYRAIVSGIARRIAPAIPFAHSANFQRGLRCAQPVGPIKYISHGKNPKRRDAVAFFPFLADAGAADRATARAIAPVAGQPQDFMGRNFQHRRFQNAAPFGQTSPSPGQHRSGLGSSESNASRGRRG